MTETDVANMALSRLGEESISNITDNDTRAISCRVHYELVRDALLRSHPWNFATARAELSATTTPPFKWDYAFILPDDFLRLITFNGVDAAMAVYEYTLEEGKILTEASSAKITYVKKITDPTLFDPLFTEVLTFRLASAIAMDITSEPSKRDEMEILAEQRLQKATFTDAGERRARVANPVSEMTARVRGIPDGLIWPYTTADE